jgi:hypothetical protein
MTDCLLHSKAKNVCGLCRHISILEGRVSCILSEDDVDLMILQFLLSQTTCPRVRGYCKAVAIPSTNAATPTAPGSGGKDSAPT